MRIHHILAITILLLATCATCNDAPQQTGTLCAGECPKKPTELVPVSWGRAIYMPSPGIEFSATVIDVAPDGVAELLIAGLNAEHAPGFADSITVTAPCHKWAGPAATQRPLDVAWAWPTDKAADARAGAFAGTMADGSIRVAIGGDPVNVLTLPALDVTDYPAWIPDPSAKMGDGAAAWEAACRTP